MLIHNAQAVYPFSLSWCWQFYQLKIWIFIRKSLKKKKNHKEKCSLKKGFERKVGNFQNTTETTVKHGCNNDG